MALAGTRPFSWHCHGDVGKGSAFAMRGAGTRGLIGEVDSICALPACTEGLTVKSVVGEINIFATAIVGMFFLDVLIGTVGRFGG